MISKNEFAALFNNAHGVIGKNTSLFVGGTGMPHSGKWVLLKSDKANVKVECSQNSPNLNVYYKAVNEERTQELWISKNTLFGRHYVTREGDFPMSELQCRTKGLTTDLYYTEELELGEGTNARKIYAAVFPEDISFIFDDIDAFTPGSTDPSLPAWDKENKVMRCHKHVEDYVILNFAKQTQE